MRPLTCNGSINGSIYDLMVPLRADGWGGAQLEESRGALEAHPLLLCLVFSGCYEVSTFPQPSIPLPGLRPHLRPKATGSDEHGWPLKHELRSNSPSLRQFSVTAPF